MLALPASTSLLKQELASSTKDSAAAAAAAAMADDWEDWENEEALPVLAGPAAAAPKPAGQFETKGAEILAKMNAVDLKQFEDEDKGEDDEDEMKKYAVPAPQVCVGVLAGWGRAGEGGGAGGGRGGGGGCSGAGWFGPCGRVGQALRRAWAAREGGRGSRVGALWPKL